MEKAIKNKVAKAVVPAIDVMFQALRLVLGVFFFLQAMQKLLIKIVMSSPH